MAADLLESFETCEQRGLPRKFICFIDTAKWAAMDHKTAFRQSLKISYNGIIYYSYYTVLYGRYTVLYYSLISLLN